MQPIATFTKIHGKGNIEVIMNNIVNRELMRQRELEHQELERERDYANMIKNRRNELLKEKCAMLKANECKRCNANFFHKAKEKILFVWACIYCYAYNCKLITYEGVWKRK